jgi:hypothetical protein
MAKYIYVWDERVTKKGWGGPVTKRGENNVMLIKVTAKDPMSAIVSRILNWVEPTGIEVLRILAHGDGDWIPGHPEIPPLSSGTGQLGAEGVTPQMISKWAVLKGKFAPGGRVEMHHCLLADPRCQVGLKGNVRCSDWLEKLADAIDAPVVAAEQIQWADAEWKYEGPTHTYWPKRTRDVQAAVERSLYY